MSLLIGAFLFVVLALADMPAGAALMVGAAFAALWGRLDSLEHRLRERAIPPIETGTPVPAARDTRPVPTPRPAPTPAAPAAPSALPPAPAGRQAVARTTSSGAGTAPKMTSSLDRAFNRWRAASAGEVEQLVAGRLLPIVGGLALVIGAVFFLGLAFSRGWIGEEARVLIGLVAGTGGFALGTVLLGRRQPILGHVLIAVGLGVITLALFAATRLYGLVPGEFGVLGALLAAASAAIIAVRGRSQAVAVFGLVSVLAAPPVMGAPPTLLTVLFLGAALAGTTGIALYTAWRWLPSLAFLLTVPQVASFIGGSPEVALGLPALAGFAALNAAAAAGEEFRAPRRQLTGSSALLLVANAAFLIGAGLSLLDGPFQGARGIFLVAVAIAHMGLGAVFLVRDGDRHPFGMLAFGTGIAAVTLAVPLQLGGAPVPIAWAAEAVALAWVYSDRRHPFSGLGAATLGILTVGHLLIVEYPIEGLFAFPKGSVPFVNPNAAALGFVLGASVVALGVLRRSVERSVLGAVALTVVVIALPSELFGTTLVATLGLVGVVAVAARRRWISPDPADVRLMGVSLTPAGPLALESAAGLALAVAAGHLATRMLIPADFVRGLLAGSAPDGVPFLDAGTGAVLMLVIAGGAMGALARERPWPQVSVLLSAAAVAYLLPFELAPTWAAVGWAAIAAGFGLIRRRLDDRFWQGGQIAAAAASATWALTLLAAYLPPTTFWGRLLTSASAVPGTLGTGTLAVFAFAAAAVAVGWLAPGRGWRAGALLVLAGLVAYLAPFHLPPFGTVVVWAGLAAGGMLLARRGDPWSALRAGGDVLASAALIVALGSVVPPGRLVVDPYPSAALPLLNGSTLALLVVAGVTALRAWVARPGWQRLVLLAIAGALAVYLPSVAVVDLVESFVGGEIGFEDLRRTGQVALSVTWAVLGVAILGAGLGARRLEIRAFGLGMLALVTVKVFVVDLAALDIAFRVLSFVGLGVLLLGGGWLYVRLQGRTSARS